MPFRAAASPGVRSSLLSNVLADVNEGFVDVEAEELLSASRCPAGKRTCRGEEVAAVEKVCELGDSNAAASSKTAYDE